MKLLKGLIYKFRFYKLNKHNYCRMESLFPVNRVYIGKGTYGPLNIKWMTTKDAKVEIGNYVSIGPKVTFLVGGEHNYHRISTYPFQSMIYKETTNQIINRDIIIEDDVWIEYDTLIMSGVTIGRGSVIGARSIVTKNVPAYSIFIGNKVVKKRFSEDIIAKLKKIDWHSVNHNISDKYKDYCQMEVNEENVDEIIKYFIRENKN